MLEFKTIIDTYDNQPKSINPNHVRAVFKFNDSEQTCILLEAKTVLSNGYHISVNAKREDVVAFLEGKVKELIYFSDETEEVLTEEDDAEKKYNVLINCPTTKSMHCAITILTKNGIVEDTKSARLEAVVDMSAIFAENPSAWFTAATNLDYTTATALKCEMQNSTCINVKMEEMQLCLRRAVRLS